MNAWFCRNLQVVAVDLNAPPAFDVAIHIRTLELIEDMNTEDGHAIDAAAKAARYLRSAAFESMVRCFAVQVSSLVKSIAQHVWVVRSRCRNARCRRGAKATTTRSTTRCGHKPSRSPQRSERCGKRSARTR